MLAESRHVVHGPRRRAPSRTFRLAPDPAVYRSNRSLPSPRFNRIYRPIATILNTKHSRKTRAKPLTILSAYGIAESLGARSPSLRGLTLLTQNCRALVRDRGDPSRVRADFFVSGHCCTCPVHGSSDLNLPELPCIWFFPAAESSRSSACDAQRFPQSPGTRPSRSHRFRYPHRNDVEAANRRQSIRFQHSPTPVARNARGLPATRGPPESPLMVNRCNTKYNQALERVRTAPGPGRHLPSPA